MQLPKITFWRVVLVIILAAGLYSTILRFAAGLGASTALSDQFPWGLWIGFDILCGVALAAGGFTMSAVVYVFNIKRFKPIIRPTILTAFLGYVLAVTALMFDLGRPYRIWHAMIMWNPHSVMFEVAWCVMLYTTVLALEFSPLVFERFRWHKLLRVIHAVTIPLVMVGVILSCLHQSSLGSLYLIVPEKLHPLWYSPLLPFFFFVSAVALGCGMTIFESFLSYRAFHKKLEMDILSDLGKVMVVALSIFLVLKLQDLSGRGVLAMAFQATYAARMFQAEMLIGVLAPIILLSIPRVRNDVFGLFFGSLLGVMGIIMNRLNVSITGIEALSGMRYVPTLTEASVTLSIVAFGFLLFALAVKYLHVFEPEDIGSAKGAEAPHAQIMDIVRNPLTGGRGISLALGTVFLLIFVGLAYAGLRYRTLETPKPSPDVAVADMTAGIKNYQPPAPITLTGAKDSPGPVTFNHESHVDASKPMCTQCHSGRFPMMKGKGAPSMKEMHKACGTCHNSKTAFAIEDDCTMCHQ